MKIKKFRDDVKLPTKSHPSDGGLDIYLPDGFEIKPFETLTLGLGIGVAIPEGCAGMLVPRSSMAKKGLIMQTQLIDAGYTGEIHLIITNCSSNYYNFQPNDRVCSLVAYNLINPYLEIVDELPTTDRGSNGLGSSGK